MVIQFSYQMNFKTVMIRMWIEYIWLWFLTNPVVFEGTDLKLTGEVCPRFLSC